MKKIIALTFALILSLAVFTACSSNDNKNDEPTYDVNKVYEKISSVATVENASEVNEEYMNYINIDKDMYDAYKGSYCPITPGVDIVIVVQAKDGKAADVEKALTARRDEIFRANENYPGANRDKAEAGRVVVKGNYVVLVIAGDPSVCEAEGAEKAYEPIDKAIDEAFK